MDLTPGRTLELTLHSFAHDGRAVGRPDGGGPAVFVSGGLAGRRVEAKITAVRPNMVEAVALRTLQPVPPSFPLQGDLSGNAPHAPRECSASMGHTVTADADAAKPAGERPAPCPHAGECGGCPWQELPYPSQLYWKGRLLADALTRIGHLTLPDGLLRPVLPSADTALGPGEWHYRNKMEFAFAPARTGGGTPGHQAHPKPCGRPLLGLRRRYSRDVVEVTHCLLQTPRTMAVLAALRELAARSGLPARDDVEHARGGALRFAVIREPRQSPTGETPCLVEIITTPCDAAAARAVAVMGEALLAGPWGVTAFVHSIRRAESDVAYGEKTALVLTAGGGACLAEAPRNVAPLSGVENANALTGAGKHPRGKHAAGHPPARAPLVEGLRLSGHDAPVSFHLGHDAFFQVNTAAAECLYHTAATLAFPEGIAPGAKARGVCWDVYCGVGGLALSLAPYVHRVLGLESVASAVALARRNAAGFAHCRFETADAARLGEYFRRYGTPDLLCADPPRAGLDQRAIRAILRARPQRLLMVSCNPATLARDLAALTTAYRLEAIQPVDLFPQTPHVETVCLLSRTA